MFATIEEALRVYKKKKEEYLELIERMNQGSRGRSTKADDWFFAAKASTLTIIENVLGLSPQEVEDIENEIKTSL